MLVALCLCLMVVTCVFAIAFLIFLGYCCCLFGVLPFLPLIGIFIFMICGLMTFCMRALMNKDNDDETV